MADNSVEYIDTIEYKKLESKFKGLISAMDNLAEKNSISRKLRYADVDVEGERARGKLQPDELWISQHIIDTNIRREQSSYVQYVAQSPRAIILTDLENPENDNTILERDATNRIRFNAWQISMFANIDGMQQNGYGILELVQDQTQPGELAHEFVSYGDFGITADTKNIQDAEFISRNYYFSKTKLLELCTDEDSGFVREQVDKVIGQEPNADNELIYSNKDKSLYRIQKVMFRVMGVVHVAWIKTDCCDDWLRMPRPLYIGRRKPKQNPNPIEMLKSRVSGVPVTEPVFEKQYPYYHFPYLISENNTISQLKGRAFLDQDCQQAASSLLSSYCTAHRRASGLYFSKDVADPNDDLLLQKNIFFKPGALINAKVSQFQLTPPSSDMIGAINLLVTSNQQETSQVNFAAQNRKDSRKTATEISAATQQAQVLSTVQVVLFSNSLKDIYTTMFNIIQSRVTAGLLKVRPELIPLYARKYIVKPSGDTDVIERQKLVQDMMAGWPVMQQTPAAGAFLSDLLMIMYPERAAKYIKILEQAAAQQQSQQAQMQQAALQKAGQVASGIVDLSKQPEMFSETGKLHVLPALKQTASEIEAVTG